MKTKKYNILWIDDQHEKMMSFKVDAASEGIILNSFKSSEEGLDFLEKNIKRFDGIILDAKFFKSKSQEEGTEDYKGLWEALKKIEVLKEKKHLPYFILSGQSEIEKNDIIQQDLSKLYKKSNPQDIDRLFKDIKEAADQLPDLQLKHKYQRVLEVYDKKYLDDKSYFLVFDLLKCLDESDFINTMDDEFNKIRKVLEAAFYACNKRGILHDECIKNGEVNQTWSSRFLSGMEVKLDDGTIIKSSKTHFPQIISRHVKYLIEITGSGSHYENPDQNPEKVSKVNLRQLRSKVNSPYLFKSLVFQLLDVIIWLKAYLDENPDLQKNRSYWNEIPKKKPAETAQDDRWVSGCVINMNEKGYAFFEPDNGSENSFIPDQIVKEKSLTNGMKVKAETEIYHYKGLEKSRVKDIKLDTAKK
jgi:cold shock CspA family protein